MTQTMKQFIGSKIQKIRQSQRITQSKLAEACNVSIEAISNIERGVNYPSFENLKNICQFLNCPISDVVDNNLQMTKKRLNLETQAIAAVRHMSDEQLETAVKILHVL